MNASPSGRPSFLSFLPRFLFEADPVRSRYAVKAWAVVLLPSILLSGIVGLALPDAARPEFHLQGPAVGLAVVMLVVIGPMLETLLMIAPLLLLNRWLGPGPAVIGSALLWGVVHSLQVPSWGLVIWWPFLILSIAFLTWRSQGIGTAILMTATIHGLHNSVPAAALLLGQSGH